MANYFGTSGDDDIAAPDGPNGSPSNDIIFGFGGNDRLRGGNGNDLIFGGKGNDSISGGSGEDTLFGGKGDDQIAGFRGDDLIRGGHGNDTVIANEGNDTVYGGRGSDSILGGDGDDVLYGDGGKGSGGSFKFAFGKCGFDSTIDAGAGNDKVFGSTGNDVIIGGTGNDCLTGGDGNDQFQFARGSGKDVITDGRFLEVRRRFGRLGRHDFIPQGTQDFRRCERQCERFDFRKRRYPQIHVGRRDQTVGCCQGLFQQL